MIRTRNTPRLALFAAISMLLMSGCNDTLRQFITAVPGPGGNPAGAPSHAIVLSTNPATPSDGSVAVGSDLHIDVSGDTVVGVVPVGPNPVFLGKTTNRAFILDGQGATPNGAATVTSYIALLPQSSTPTTTTLPAGTDPVAGGFSSSGNFYLVQSANIDPTIPGLNNAGMIAANVNAITTTIPVGTNPVAVVGNNSNNKVYVVNQGSNDVTVISTIDNFVLSTIPVGTSPIWGVMATDGVHAFIVNQGSNDVSVIDTFLDKVIATIPVGSSPNYAVFEPTNQRVYVSNTGSPVISVIKANGIDLANQVLPTKIADIPIPAPATSVAALPDGSRAYAAMGGCPAGTNHTNILASLVADPPTTCLGNQVAVIDTQALALKKLITVGEGAVSIDAAGNSQRVYVIGANITVPNPNPALLPLRAANVSIINTADDTVLNTVPIPQQSLGCQNPQACTQNTTQIPFTVRVFP
ncbi:MAG TPA: YncE family protein [Candidatus Acidoferrales bacterium]|nr:YncE family protein [Candidatus Acidoferrales bacterium]